jgi:ornithine carbamoyltransferase
MGNAAATPTTDRDFLRLCDRSAAELAGLIQRAAQLCNAFAAHTPQRTLAHRRVGFIWDGEGFRNRAAFELGVQLLAGHGVSIPGRLDDQFQGVAGRCECRPLASIA